MHILGDELQGIFDFDGRCLSFENDLKDFVSFDLLQKPWRWHKEGNCRELGDKILEWRRILLSNHKQIRLESNPEAHVEVFLSQLEAQDNNQEYFVRLRDIIQANDCDSLLILFPMYLEFQGKRTLFRGKIDERVSYRARFDFEHRFLMVEAIDDKAFYANADAVDILIQKINSPRTRTSKERKIYDLMESLTFKTSGITGLDSWFNKDKEYRLRNKQGDNKDKQEKLRRLIDNFVEHPSKRGVLELINFFMKEVGMRPKRRELVSSIQYCLRNYPDEAVTVSDSMKEMRNAVRRYGRKIQGRCIGTTLLTKGLEFDTVIVLDAHRFQDSKNFYVAISRACKNLVIITKKSLLTFEK